MRVPNKKRALTMHPLASVLICGFRRALQLTERIPCPSDESDKEVQPLLRVEQPQYSDRILHFVHWRLQRAESGSQVPASAHLPWRLASRWKSCIVALIFIVLRRVVAFPVRHHAYIAMLSVTELHTGGEQSQAHPSNAQSLDATKHTNLILVRLRSSLDG